VAAARVDRANVAKYAGHSVQAVNARYVQPPQRNAERVRSAIPGRLVGQARISSHDPA
jgi:hypothetical protein